MAYTLGPFTFVTADAVVRTSGQDVSAWLSVSPRRSDHIILQPSQVWRMVSEDSGSLPTRSFLLIICTRRIFTRLKTLRVARDTQTFQQIARFCYRNYSGLQL